MRKSEELKCKQKLKSKIFIKFLVDFFMFHTETSTHSQTHVDDKGFLLSCLRAELVAAKNAWYQEIIILNHRVCRVEVVPVYSGQPI